MANWLTQMTLGTMQHVVSILLMEDILHQLIDSLSHWQLMNDLSWLTVICLDEPRFFKETRIVEDGFLRSNEILENFLVHSPVSYLQKCLLHKKMCKQLYCEKDLKVLTTYKIIQIPHGHRLWYWWTIQTLLLVSTNHLFTAWSLKPKNTEHELFGKGASFAKGLFGLSMSSFVCMYMHIICIYIYDTIVIWYT